MTTKRNYKIELLTKKDEEDTLKFLRAHFYRDEPLCQFLGIESTLENPNKALDDFSITGFDNGWGFKAVNEKKEMIGLALNMVLEKGVDENFVVDSNNKFSKIKDLIDFLMEKADIWSNNPDFKKGIQINILAVDKNYAGQGIGTELVNHVRQEAKKQNFDFMIVECSSHFSALVAKKLGFKQVFSVPYNEYKPLGDVILKPEPPHLAATVWVDKLKPDIH